MIEKLFRKKNDSETVKRSLAKTISYRLVIIICDFLAVYFFTGKIIYFLHERIWIKIKWGKTLIPQDLVPN